MLGVAAAMLPSLPSLAGMAKIEIRQVSNVGVFSSPLSITAIPEGDAAYSLATTYRSRNRDFIILLAAGSGEFAVYPLTAVGTVGPLMQSGKLAGTGWRAMGVAHDAGRPYVYLAKATDGRTLRYPIDAAGRVTVASPVWGFASTLVRKSAFDVFDQSGEPRIFGVDTFEGSSTIERLSLPAGPTGQAQLSAGWTDVDHIDVDGQVYRLHYKEAGEPYSSFGKSVAEEGRAAIVSLDADGTQASVMYDDVLLPGFDSARFVQVDVATWGFILYRRDGFTMLHAFDPYFTANTGNVMSQASTGFNFDEVLAYRTGGNTFMVGVELDTSVQMGMKLTQDQMGRLAECVHDNLAHRGVGYQLSVAQGGRQILSRAGGNKRLSPAPAPMERSTLVSIGSVSKLMTVLTALHLADDGFIDLDDSVATQVDITKYWPINNAPWMNLRTPRDLMAQVTGHESAASANCSANDDLTLTCAAFFGDDPDLACNEMAPGFECPRAYANQHFDALRLVIEGARGITTSPQLDALTRSLWLSDVVFAGGPSCQADLQSMYFGSCKQGETCIASGGESFIQAEPNTIAGWARNCAAGGWQSSADDLVAMLETLEGYGLLDTNTTDLMLDTTLTDLNGVATAMGFEAPYTSRTGGALMLGKNGVNPGDVATTSYATLLDGHGQAALSINTRTGAPLSETLFKYAYQFAIGAAPACEPLQTMPERHKVTTAHPANQVDIEALAGSSRLVVATESGASDIHVSTWRRVGYDLQEDYRVLAGYGDMVELVSPMSDRFVVAHRGPLTGELVVRSFEVDLLGRIFLRDTETVAGYVADVAVAELSSVDAEFVTVTRNANDDVEVSAWDIDAVTGALTRMSWDATSYAVQEVSVTGGNTPGRVVVGVRTVGGNVRPIVYDVAPDGSSVVRNGLANMVDVEAGSSVHITMVQTEMYNTSYVTSFNAGGTMRMIGWTVSPSGATVTKGPVANGPQINSMAGVPRMLQRPYFNVPLIDSEGEARAMGCRTQVGSFVNAAQPEAGQGTDIAVSFSWALGRHWATSAVATDTGVLELVNYESLTEAP